MYGFRIAFPHKNVGQSVGWKKNRRQKRKRQRKNPGSLDTTQRVFLLSPYVSDAGNFWTALKIDRNEIEKVNLVSIIILVVRQFS